MIFPIILNKEVLRNMEVSDNDKIKNPRNSTNNDEILGSKNLYKITDDLLKIFA